MAFQNKQVNNSAIGAAPGIGSANNPSPQGDALSSQLPTQVYQGNKVPYVRPLPTPLLMMNVKNGLGYFTGASQYGSSIIRPPALEPLTPAAGPAGGGPSGGQTHGVLAPARSRKSILTKTPTAVESKQKSLAAQQARVGRLSSAATSKKGVKPKLSSTDRILLKKQRNQKRPYGFPKTLGGGSVVRLPYSTAK